MYIQKEVKSIHTNFQIRGFLRTQKPGKHPLSTESGAAGMGAEAQKFYGGAMKLGTAAAGKATEYGVHLAYTGGDWEKAYDNMGGITLNLANLGSIFDMAGSISARHNGTGQSSLGSIARKFGSTGLLEMNIGRKGISMQLGMGGIDVGGALYDLGKRSYDKRMLKAYEREHGEAKGKAAYNAYVYGDWTQEHTAARLASGKDELEFIEGKKYTARTTSNGKGGRRIEITDSKDSRLNAIQLGHEAYRDGIRGVNNKAETLIAVKAHTEMALRMQADGKDIYGISDWLKKDMDAYNFALASGDASIFEDYASEFYNFEDDLLDFSFLDKDTKFANWCNRTVDSVLEKKQAVFDNAATKVKNGEALSKKEKRELKNAYGLIVLGGRLMGYTEAADLLSLYLNPKKAANYDDDSPYTVKTDVYKNSAIGKYAMEEMKKYILGDYDSASGAGKKYSSADLLSPTNRDPDTEGYFSAKDRVLVAEQNNQRLKNMDNRFYLDASVKTNKKGNIEITWSVTNRWRYRSYEEKNYYTELPFSKKRGQILKIDDGLSQYLTKIGMAREFYYRCEWKEIL